LHHIFDDDIIDFAFSFEHFEHFILALLYITTRRIPPPVSDGMMDKNGDAYMKMPIKIHGHNFHIKHQNQFR
jgi:hypothetical protein